MNLATAKALLKRYGFDDSDPLNEWLNAALHEVEIAHDWNFLDGTVSIVVPNVGGNILALPTSGFQTAEVIFVYDLTNGKKLEEWENTRFYRDYPIAQTLNTPGKPFIYIVDYLPGTPASPPQVRAAVWPTVDTINTTFIVGYRVSWVDGANDNDLLPGPIPMHMPIVKLAASIALQSENEEERGQSALAQYETALERLKSRYSKNTSDEPGQVTDSMGYGNNY